MAKGILTQSNYTLVNKSVIKSEVGGNLSIASTVPDYANFKRVRRTIFSYVHFGPILLCRTPTLTPQKLFSPPRKPPRADLVTWLPLLLPPTDLSKFWSEIDQSSLYPRLSSGPQLALCLVQGWEHQKPKAPPNWVGSEVVVTFRFCSNWHSLLSITII